MIRINHPPEEIDRATIENLAAQRETVQAITTHLEAITTHLEATTTHLSQEQKNKLKPLYVKSMWIREILRDLAWIALAASIWFSRNGGCR